MVFRQGSIEHAKGFVINKLFEQRRIGAKHLAIVDVPTGYPSNWRGLLPKAIDELKNEGVIRVERKRTRRNSGDHLTLVWDRLYGARALLNGYRAAVELPRVGQDLQTYLPTPRKRS